MTTEFLLRGCHEAEAGDIATDKERTPRLEFDRDRFGDVPDITRVDQRSLHPNPSQDVDQNVSRYIGVGLSIALDRCLCNKEHSRPSRSVSLRMTLRTQRLRTQ